MRAAILKTGRGIRWYLKQATGEAKWDEYLDRCRSEGVEPMTRRDFERHRAEHKENNPQPRCC
ncbi:MAG: YbdD/YjiX family protein [Propionibacteriales bacterium]|nr:YbdD/YjiX family protein [Propionibacteriales bacterium]